MSHCYEYAFSVWDHLMRDRNPGHFNVNPHTSRDKEQKLIRVIADETDQ